MYVSHLKFSVINQMEKLSRNLCSFSVNKFGNPVSGPFYMTYFQTGKTGLICVKPNNVKVAVHVNCNSQESDFACFLSFPSENGSTGDVADLIF